MESYYEFGFYSDKNRSKIKARNMIQGLFLDQGHDLSNDDCSNITTRTIIEEEDIVKVAITCNCCMFVEYSNDDDSLGFYSFIVSNKGVITKSINYIDYESEEQRYYEAVDTLRENFKYEFIDQHGNKPKRSIHTLVLGIHFEGKLVHDRYEPLKKLCLEDTLFLLREPNNQYDSNAIMVVNENNQDLGYIPRGYALELAPLLDKEKEYTIKITNISYSGVSIDITI